jgi:hypothetical protein
MDMEFNRIIETARILGKNGHCQSLVVIKKLIFQAFCQVLEKEDRLVSAYIREWRSGHKLGLVEALQIIDSFLGDDNPVDYYSLTYESVVGDDLIEKEMEK